MENTGIFDKNWKALIKPSKLEVKSNDDKSVADVVVQPLEKGFGQTIGNSLRRDFTFINSRSCSDSNSNRRSASRIFFNKRC